LDQRPLLKVRNRTVNFGVFSGERGDLQEKRGREGEVQLQRTNLRIISARCSGIAEKKKKTAEKPRGRADREALVKTGEKSNQE